MINLFKITDTYEVELDKEWIALIPAFSAILKADKGSKGDADGRKKLLARKQLAYLYFMIDFRSPIFSYDEAKKKVEALRYVGLDELEVASPLITEGLEEYKAIQLGQARALRSLENAYSGLNALDDYLRDVDFTATDKQGKLLHSPKEYMANLSSLNKAYDELEKFEKRVHKQLQESNTTIRGMADLGDREKMKDDKQKVWEESAGPVQRAGAQPKSPAFGDLSVMMNKVKAKPKAIFEADDDEEIS